MTTQPSPQKKKKPEWPKGVREYVSRAYCVDNEIPGIETSEMETMLKKIISGASNSGRLNDLDWDNYPLPQEIIREDMAKAMAASPSTPLIPRESGDTRSNLSIQMSKSRKRKSSDSVSIDSDRAPTPPWRKTTNRNVFEDRITYPTPAEGSRKDKRQRKNDKYSTNGSSKYQENLQKRKQRFENGKAGNNSPHPWSSQSSPREESPIAPRGPVVGTCQQLEKKYFRLTSAPKPETVRPQPVLEKTLELLKKKWKKEQNYSYICDQFKSLRQDLTVQHIKNEFTVNVYEIHARIALEQGDLGEYNQCQTQLRALYSQNLGGHPAEFLAYRILYFIYTCNRTDMNDVLADLTPADKSERAVQHALDVRSSLALGNYHKFFRLYLDPPFMGAYLMDRFIVRERFAALANMCKAYKFEIPIEFLTEELGFESYAECVQFLCEHGAEEHVVNKGNERILLDAGKSLPLFEQQKQAAFRKVDIKGQI